MKGSLALFALSVGLLTACSDEPSASPAFLFLIDSGGASVVDGSSGHELVFPADQVVTWFTDRPFRQAGNLSLQELVATWEADGFTADPPEAAIDVTVDGRDDTFVVELGVPTVDGESIRIPVSEVQVVGEDVAVHAGRAATTDVFASESGDIAVFIESTNTCSACSVVNS